MSSQTVQYRKRYVLDRSRGITRTVPAGPVREHLGLLRERGMSYDAIADAAATGKTTIHRIATGISVTVRRDAARRLLAVAPAQVLDRPNPAAFVPNVGARRRIRALLAAGWRHVDITAAAGYSGASSTPRSAVILHQRGEWIARETHDAIAEAYNVLGGRTGPAGITRARALAAGHPPPAAWDDELIDDPTALPAPGWRPGECTTPGCAAEPARGRGGSCVRCYDRRRRSARSTDLPEPPTEPGVDLDEFLWLVNGGEHPVRAARRLGVSLEAVDRRARRARRSDVTHITTGIAQAERARASRNHTITEGAA
ncbi:MAG: hypothetical protein K0R97_2976 [Oerskovia sp.]|nr:hypothetical protein [Oerskovia sp.]